MKIENNNMKDTRRINAGIPYLKYLKVMHIKPHFIKGYVSTFNAKSCKIIRYKIQ